MQFNFDDGWGEEPATSFLTQHQPVPQPVAQPIAQQPHVQSHVQQPVQQPAQEPAPQQPAYDSSALVDQLGYSDDGWGNQGFSKGLEGPYNQAGYAAQKQPTFTAEAFEPKADQKEEPVVEEVVVQEAPVENNPPQQQSFQKPAAVRVAPTQNHGWTHQKRAPKVRQQQTRMEAQPQPMAAANESKDLQAVVNELLARVSTLEHERYLIQNCICTLNSNGSTQGHIADGKGSLEKISWGNESHIMAPEKGMSLNEDNTILTIENAGIYQIVFNSLGKNPRIVIDNSVFAGTKSSNGSCVVDFIVSLGENSQICACVEKSQTADATDTWLCVRLLSVYADFTQQMAS